MDLDIIDSVAACSKPLAVEILDHLDRPTDCVFYVLGQDNQMISDRFAEIETAKETAAARGKPMKTEELNKRYEAIVADAVTGWENLTDKGKPVPFSKETARAVVAKYPKLRTQLLKAMMDTSAFLDQHLKSLESANS